MLAPGLLSFYPCREILLETLLAFHLRLIFLCHFWFLFFLNESDGWIDQKR